ncbi:HP1 family phage holin [Actinobacillus porcinus]|uniref:HP1 family phage holin n=1 Tax=Actinobacillus porcinus TaxID=51048 RepID=UPI002354FBE0|nr:holin [Actinobacillus porcinus]MCI5763310.1 phage holin family protein [Actinobacillus porcinus]MDY5421166.1 holin [Actinobacillus porcinus]
MNKQTENLSYFGAFMTFMTGLSWSDLASIFGILFGLATLLINWHYKQKDYELRKLEIEKGLSHEKTHH